EAWNRHSGTAVENHTVSRLNPRVPRESDRWRGCVVARHVEIRRQSISRIHIHALLDGCGAAQRAAELTRYLPLSGALGVGLGRIGALGCTRAIALIEGRGDG